MTVESSLPERIGPYRVTGPLARGGMGEVLRGHDDRLGRPVALKRIRPDARDPEGALRRFQREARAVARLSHSSIVQVYDWAETDGQHWLVMELVDGRALDRVAAEGRLALARALEIGRDIASALAEAHDAGIVHRDLKTSNVLLTRRGRAKVLDFGLAKPVAPRDPEESVAAAEESSARLTAEGHLLGTIHAMSPEQALGREVDPRSDLFSLGVLLYELLAGVPPFDGRNPPEILHAICNVPEPPLHRLDPEIPDAVSAFVGRLLEKDPALRPSDAHEVAAELDRLLAAPEESSDESSAESESARATTRLDLETLPDGALSGDALPAATSSRRVAAISGLGLLALGLLAWGTIAWLDESDDARSSAETAAEPTAEPTKTELYRRGYALLDQSDRIADIEAAIRDFQAALAFDPRYAPALAGLARAYRLDHERGSREPQRLDQALAAARQAVALDGYLAVARVDLGRVYFAMGRLEEAVDEFEHALELEPSNAGALAGLGEVHAARGEHELAERYLLRALDARPDIDRLLSFLGEIYYRAGRYDDAAEAFSRHLERDPDSFVASSNLGATYYMQGRLSEAAAEFQRALAIEPEPALYSNVGTIYFTQGLYAQSAEAFEKAIETGLANDPLMWGNLGDARRWTPGQEAASRDAYLRAIQLLDDRATEGVEDPTSLSRRILFRAKRGDCARALAEARSLEDTPELDGGAWYRLAVAREICDARVAALASLRAALDARFSLDAIQRDPELEALRQDVRFHRLAREHLAPRAEP